MKGVRRSRPTSGPAASQRRARGPRRLVRRGRAPRHRPGLSRRPPVRLRSPRPSNPHRRRRRSRPRRPHRAKTNEPAASQRRARGPRRPAVAVLLHRKRRHPHPLPRPLRLSPPPKRRLPPGPRVHRSPETIALPGSRRRGHVRSPRVVVVRRLLRQRPSAPPRKRQPVRHAWLPRGPVRPKAQLPRRRRSLQHRQPPLRRPRRQRLGPRQPRPGRCLPGLISGACRRARRGWLRRGRARLRSPSAR